MPDGSEVAEGAALLAPTIETVVPYEVKALQDHDDIILCELGGLYLAGVARVSELASLE